MIDRLRYVATTGARRRLRDVLLQPDRLAFREDLARRYLRGDGIEIGAATWPLRVPPQARVRYVDRLPRDELVASYAPILAAANLAPGSIPGVDVIDDAATLATFADVSVDFVIANHVLEHLEDPIGALESFCRVVRPGGTVFVTLPDAATSFDAPRDRTTVEHALRDHREGPQTSRRGHYEEWAVHIDGATGDAVAARADVYEREAARHHFHVWELDGFLELVRAARLPARLACAQAGEGEFAVVLTKRR